MYFHGLEDVGTQVSRVATSRNGIEFEAQPEILGPSYMRIFSHHGMTYALTEGLDIDEPADAVLLEPGEERAHDDALPDEPGRPRCPLPQWRVVRPSILCGRSVVNNSGA
jgi:hypothetical protein